MSAPRPMKVTFRTPEGQERTAVMIPQFLAYNNMKSADGFHHVMHLHNRETNRSFTLRLTDIVRVEEVDEPAQAAAPEQLPDLSSSR
jgi:hypothetical protein